jgi:hypothetical protein
MSATATATATSTTTNENATKRNFAFNAGVETMKDNDIFNTTRDRLAKLATLAAPTPDLAFDLLYVNMPWKTVSVDDAMTLPIADLTKKDNAGLLLWVDSPNIVDATKILATWGFAFHSVLHVTTYASPSANVSPTPTTTTTVDTAEDPAVDTADTASTKPLSAKKGAVPTGWNVQGIVPSRSRQLWFAVKGDAGAFLKDASFIRKRLPATSVFEFSKEEVASTALSSKKKNLDEWIVYPEYLAYVPLEVETALGTIHKASAKVLSLFSDKLHRQWYTWGPNVPGYVCCPMRPDGGFSIMNAFLKYFGAMKGATVQKYLTLMNLYAVQSAKQIGHKETGNIEMDEDGNPKQFLTPLVAGRMKDFCEDVIRRYEETGGIQASPLSDVSLVNLDALARFADLKPIRQTQILLLVAQIIRGVVQKHADASLRRKKLIKRKREAMEEDGEGEAERPREPRKFGIAAPVDISEELCTFLGLVPGEQVARTTVVKQINQYISEKHLQNPERRSEILCDEPLQKLLNPGPNFVVNYFNLCKLLGPHFISAKKAGKGDTLAGKAAATPATGTGSTPGPKVGQTA